MHVFVCLPPKSSYLLHWETLYSPRLLDFNSSPLYTAIGEGQLLRLLEATGNADGDGISTGHLLEQHPANWEPCTGVRALGATNRHYFIGPSWVFDCFWDSWSESVTWGRAWKIPRPQMAWKPWNSSCPFLWTRRWTCKSCSQGPTLFLNTFDPQHKALHRSVSSHLSCAIYKIKIQTMTSWGQRHLPTVTWVTS